MHRDNGLLTFSMLLNEPNKFTGGGTYFEDAGRVYRPSRGVGVLHSALVRHAGYPIEAGTRYVLVGFCGLTSSNLPRGFEDWRFGDPPWFVSSRVVADKQILDRVWPPEGREMELGQYEEEEEGEEGEAIEFYIGNQDDDDEEEYPTLEELLESGELSEEEFKELSGGEIADIAVEGGGGDSGGSEWWWLLLLLVRSLGIGNSTRWRLQHVTRASYSIARCSPRLSLSRCGGMATTLWRCWSRRRMRLSSRARPFARAL